jgi:hypothetical protein
MTQIQSIKEIVTFAECLSFCGIATTATDHQMGILNQVKGPCERAIRAELQCGVVETQYTEFLPKMANPADMRDQIRSYLSPYHIGDGGTVLQLSEIPVRSVQSVVIDRSGRAGQNPQGFPSTDTLVIGQDCYLDEQFPGYCDTGHLVRVGWAWFADVGSIKVTYVAGWTPRELRGDVEDYRRDASDIRLGTLLTIQSNFALINAMSTNNGLDPFALSLGGRINSERLGDYSIGYGYPQPVDAKGVIDNPMIPPRAAALLGRFKRINSWVM